jgi:hypothetical protein
VYVFYQFLKLNFNHLLSFIKNSIGNKNDRFSVNVLPDLLPQQAAHLRQFTDQPSSEEYRQAIGSSPKIPHQERSFTAFGFNNNNNGLNKNSPNSSSNSSSSSNNIEILKRNNNPQMNVREKLISFFFRFFFLIIVLFSDKC